MNTLEKIRDLADQDQRLAEELLASGAFPEELLGQLMDSATGDDILLLVGLAQNPHLSAFEVRNLVAIAERVTQESGGKTGDTFPLIDFVMRELAENPATPLSLLIEARSAFGTNSRFWMDSVISHPHLPMDVYRLLVQGLVDNAAPSATGDLGTIFTPEDLNAYFTPSENTPVSISSALSSKHFMELDEDAQFTLLASAAGDNDSWTLRWTRLPVEVAPSVLADLYEMLLKEDHPYFDQALGQIVNHPRFPEDSLDSAPLEVNLVDGELVVSDRAMRIIMSSRSQSAEVMEKVLQLVTHTRVDRFFEVLNHGFGFEQAHVNGTPRSEQMLLEVLRRLEEDPKVDLGFTQLTPVIAAILANPGVTTAVVDKISRMVPVERLSEDESPYFDYTTLGSIVMHPLLSEKMRDALLRHGSATLAEMAHFQDFGALPQSPQVAHQVLSAQVHSVPSAEELGGGSRGCTESIHQEAMIGIQWLELLWKHADEVAVGPSGDDWFDVIASVTHLVLADGAEGHDWKRLAVLLGLMDRDDLNPTP